MRNYSHAIDVQAIWLLSSIAVRTTNRL